MMISYHTMVNQTVAYSPARAEEESVAAANNTLLINIVILTEQKD
jgi:hypothetical protein